jgi:hypothetical protein
MSQRSIQALLHFAQDYGLLLGLGVAALLAVNAGVVLRRRSPTRSKGKTGAKAEKEEFLQDLALPSVDGGDDAWQDDGLMQLEESDDTEYYKDDEY